MDRGQWRYDTLMGLQLLLNNTWTQSVDDRFDALLAGALRDRDQARYNAIVDFQVLTSPQSLNNGRKNRIAAIFHQLQLQATHDGNRERQREIDELNILVHTCPSYWHTDCRCDETARVSRRQQCTRERHGLFSALQKHDLCFCRRTTWLASCPRLE